MTDLTEARLRLGEAAVLPWREAVRLLPGGAVKVRAWLRARGLVRSIEGTEVVIWGEVLAALRQEEQRAEEPTRPGWGGMPRKRLR